MDKKSSSVIYKIFYFTLHFVFTLYELTKNICNNVRNKLLELCHEFLPINSRHSIKIDKIPKHLTVLLGSEEPSYKDLTNLILWCLAARITFISFYDHKGTLQKNEDKFYQIVKEKKGELDHVIWHKHSDSFHKNGYTGKKIHVKVLSHENGRSAIVELTKKLATSSSTNITINSFDEGLRNFYEFPDPDLGLCCGKTFSLYGYPPWQSRVTEFLSLNSHHNITFKTFVNLLVRYSKCEQRYGK